MEEPGYLDVRAALLGAGARIVPVPVDESGLTWKRR
jgi:GntR family transcriptional regulator/MocR family aminotransferase